MCRSLFRLFAGLQGIPTSTSSVKPTLRPLSTLALLAVSHGFKALHPYWVRCRVLPPGPFPSCPYTPPRLSTPAASATVAGACRSCLLVKTSAVCSASRPVQNVAILPLPSWAFSLQGFPPDQSFSAVSSRLPVFRFDGLRVLAPWPGRHLSCDRRPSWVSWPGLSPGPFFDASSCVYEVRLFIIAKPPGDVKLCLKFFCVAFKITDVVPVCRGLNTPYTGC